ncbi:hypothetical protein Lal_00032766 [Lupinus albus]|uniref:Putative histone-lysine N-methyltransferase chromatin regulator PHD family n=1 Tax=Lupinus albus TaxID=3870 RepID=A0A6A5PLU0_LUPAL|nr:putative histone-lysine N-methyltransferase chromatin regulator PHD family [Lupinus albus]KAF1898004.1 hypothetical protein Lal_00032766 [Lupinus albus]
MSHSLNPWMFNFQKLALELKCPLCLSLFKDPMLLPCNHLFCKYCLGDFTMGVMKCECAVCKTKYAERDVRSMPFVENMVSIYRSLESTFSPSLIPQCSSDDARVLAPCQASLNSSYGNKMTDKVMLSLPHSNEVGAGKNHKLKGSDSVVHDKTEELELSPGGRVDSHSTGKPSPMQHSQMGVGGHAYCKLMEMDVNQVMQSATGSPLFCDTKGSDCSDLDSEHPLVAGRSEKSSLKRAIAQRETLIGRRKQFRSGSSASETDGLMIELIRQKNHLAADGYVQSSSTDHNNLVGSCSNLDPKSGKGPGAMFAANPDDSHTSTSICSFCQSSKISEATGEMLHSANGYMVTGDKALQPNVIHVHKICANWAPQAYFVDDIVKNLKSEVARGSKLKCSKCGLKGAALGCLVKSCRKTYHAPCAMEILTCRFDYENFLMLCPAHARGKFPNEKSWSKKQPTQNLPALSHLPSHEPNPLPALQDDSKKLVFCGSALPADEKALFVNFASKFGAAVTKYWTPNVTHVIAATDENGACSRTRKVLMAILNGQWILKMDWVKACMEGVNMVEEEPYEISLDNQGCHGGPKSGRLRALANEPKLFSDFKFYFSGDYVTTYKEDLEDLVEVGGGTVLRSKEELEAKRHEFVAAPWKLLIVYNIDPPQGCKLGEEVSILWQRLNDAQDLAANTGYQIIGHTWILESIAACNLQPFVS